jgi:hypothetical protein
LTSLTSKSEEIVKSLDVAWRDGEKEVTRELLTRRMRDKVLKVKMQEEWVLSGKNGFFL